MVVSVIKPEEIKYNENRSIDKEDINYTTLVYESELYDEEIEVVLGKEKETYADKDITYFSIYLIINDTPVLRIGIFEIDSNKLLNNKDTDEGIDLEKGEIIFFINKEELLKQKRNQNVEKKVDMLDNEEYILTSVDYEDIMDTVEDENKDLMRINTDEIKTSKVDNSKKGEDKIFKENDNVITMPLLEEENEKASDKEKLEYKESVRNTWIEQFTKNNQFGIIDNEGGGDCLFATVRDAFRGIGKDTSIDKLRSIVAKEATEEIYENYRNLYLSFFNEYKDKERQMKELQKQITRLKKRVEQTTSKEDNELLMDQIKGQVDLYKQLSNDKKETKELLKEFEDMKDIDDVDKFRDFIKSNRFWGDTWAITTLEKILNIKIIILSEEAYANNDMDAIMQCGQINDSEIEDTTGFKPDYYVMASYTGNHYKLITYKKKNILKFKEIPYDIKTLIVNKCLERNAGPYYLIQDFKKYKMNIGLDENMGKPSDNEDDLIQKDLYDNKVVFMYHSKSDNKPKAGKGSGEKVDEQNMLEYKDLNKIKEWRKKLDDQWMVPLTVDGLRWSSVMHYYLGSQYKKGFPNFYKDFSIEGNSDFSNNIDKAIAAGSKTGMYKNKQLRSKEIKVDSDFFEIGLEPRYIIERERALEAKFIQNQDMKQVLMETQRAKLVQFHRGKDSVVDESLMKLRRKIA